MCCTAAHLIGIDWELHSPLPPRPQPVPWGKKLGVFSTKNAGWWGFWDRSHKSKFIYTFGCVNVTLWLVQLGNNMLGLYIHVAIRLLRHLYTITTLYRSSLVMFFCVWWSQSVHALQSGGQMRVKKCSRALHSLVCQGQAWMFRWRKAFSELAFSANGIDFVQLRFSCWQMNHEICFHCIWRLNNWLVVADWIICRWWESSFIVMCRTSGSSWGSWSSSKWIHCKLTILHLEVSWDLPAVGMILQECSTAAVELHIFVIICTQPYREFPETYSGRSLMTYQELCRGQSTLPLYCMLSGCDSCYIRWSWALRGQLFVVRFFLRKSLIFSCDAICQLVYYDWSESCMRDLLSKAFLISFMKSNRMISLLSSILQTLGFRSCTGSISLVLYHRNMQPCWASCSEHFCPIKMCMMLVEIMYVFHALA